MPNAWITGSLIIYVNRLILLCYGRKRSHLSGNGWLIEPANYTMIPKKQKISVV